MHLHPAQRELVFKLVYCGPGLAGKTSNLQWLRSQAPAGHAGELISVEAHSERTIHFDLLNPELGPVQGNQVRLDLWTVPGQSYYAATRRQVLTGADGVVFVADSRREALDENIDAMNEMLGNLRAHGLGDDLPVVLQYNKQDLPTAVAPDQLAPLLNVRSWTSLPAVAVEGRGVAETLQALARLVVERAQGTQLPALGSGAAAPTPASAPAPAASLLISCHRCQAMLEVPSARPGEIYQCGVCSSQLEVVDGDRGITRAPVTAPVPAPATAPQGEDQYAMGDAADQAAALMQPGVATLSPSAGQMVIGGPAGAGEQPYEVPGYTIVSLIDETCQGRRFRVRETASGRTFRALSVSPALLTLPGYRDNLEPYVRMAGQIRHPNLLPLVTMRMQGEGAAFISQDPPDHEPLSHVLARRRALAPPHAMGLLRQVALALEEGARHGAVHGWLRPEVVLVSTEGNVLVDELCVPVHHRFLVRELAGASAATEYYLAPEHLSDESRPDVRSDMFLLGALLFRMMTGQGLVTGYNAHEALHKTTANGARSLRDAQAGVSRELNTFYQRLVAIDRRERFQNFKELIDALDRFGGGAKRQNLQLTAHHQRGPGARSAPRPGSGGRRSASTAGTGTGPLPGGQPRTRSITRPTGEAALAPRAKKSDSGIMTLVVVLVVIALAAVVAVIVIQGSGPRGQAVQADSERLAPSSTNQSAAKPPPPTSTPATAKPVVPTTAPVAAKPTIPTITPVATRPATPAPDQVATPAPETAPAPEAPTAPVVRLDAQTRMAVMRELTDLILAERYKEALALCARFDDQEERTSREQQVQDRRLTRKQVIEGMVATGTPTEDIRTALAKVPGWGYPEDEAWAAELLKKAEARPPSAIATRPDPAAKAPVKTPAKTTPPTTNPTGTKTPPAPAPAPDPIPSLSAIPTETALGALNQVSQALLNNQPQMTQGAMSGLDPTSDAGRALKRLVELWAARLATLEKAVASGAVKLRVTHPTTGELCDITAGDQAGATLTAANGSASVISWALLPARVQAKLFLDAAAQPGADGNDIASAIAMQVLADDLPQAVVQSRRGKGLIATEIQNDLQRAIDLLRRRQTVATINRAVEAVQSGNLKGASEAMTEVRRLDKHEAEPYSATIQALEQTMGSGPGPAAKEAGAPATGSKAAALKALGWDPLGGAHLDPTGIILPPAGKDGVQSGIAGPLAAKVSGWMVSARGSGTLLVIPLDKTGKPMPGATLPIDPKTVRKFNLRFDGGFLTVTDEGGKTVIQKSPLPQAAAGAQILANGEALLPTAPVALQ